MQIERGFQNNYGENFANIVNVGFSSLSELRDFLGKFITETKKENNNKKDLESFAIRQITIMIKYNDWEWFLS